MIQIACDDHTVSASLGVVPAIYSAYARHAKLHDDLGVQEGPGTALVIAVAKQASTWPELVIAQRFSPGPEAGFHPGVHVARETGVLFLGAGTRLLAYDLRAPKRLWVDQADTGFWRWRRHGEVILMSAELELAAWDLAGRKLWSTSVEPPWEYAVRDTRVHLDVMGTKSEFPLREGPSSSRGELAYSVWRQDDNGNRFEVARGLSWAAASRSLARFEASGHKQMFWIEPSRGPKGEPKGEPCC